MPKLGILFDIDELGGGLYGMAAYKVLFSSIDTRRLAGCGLSDGDTSATLAGKANHYCIAVDSPDPSKIALVRQALARSSAKGLLPPSERFLEDEQVQSEPLVDATQVTTNGEVIGGAPWISGAWKQAQQEMIRQTTEIHRSNAVNYCIKCGAPVEIGTRFCPKCGAVQGIDVAFAGPSELMNVYGAGFEMARIPPAQVEQFKKHGLVETFPPALTVLLHIFTVGIFTVIFQGLKHSKLPHIRHDDFGAGKAIGFLFIPFFNFYWGFIFWLRLVDRINFQFRLRGEPDAINRGLALTTCILSVIPYVNLLVGFPIMTAILSAQVQSAANRLAEKQMQVARPTYA